MMHKAWSSIEEVPYCFSRSSVKFQGHTALKIVEFDPNWTFPDCNSSLNLSMAMECCTRVTRDKTSPILTQIGRFPTIGRSQLTNPSDLPCSPQKSYYTHQNHIRHTTHRRDTGFSFLRLSLTGVIHSPLSSCMQYQAVLLGRDFKGWTWLANSC